MSFMWPTMLLSLLAMPLFVLAYLWIVRRRRRLAAGLAGLGLGQEGGPRQYIPAAILMAGLTLLLVALARPQAVVSLPRVEGTVILAFDVSGSMAANDPEFAGSAGGAGTRLEAAKAAAMRFLEHQPDGVQVGVVAFSDNGFTVQAPTEDQEAILSTISRLAPESGTSVANGILAALNLLATRNSQPTPRSLPGRPARRARAWKPPRPPPCASWSTNLTASRWASSPFPTTALPCRRPPATRRRS